MKVFNMMFSFSLGWSCCLDYNVRFDKNHDWPSETSFDLYLGQVLLFLVVSGFSRNGFVLIVVVAEQHLIVSDISFLLHQHPKKFGQRRCREWCCWFYYHC